MIICAVSNNSVKCNSCPFKATTIPHWYGKMLLDCLYPTVPESEIIKDYLDNDNISDTMVLEDC